MVDPHKRSIRSLEDLKYVTPGDRTLIFYIGFYMVLIGQGFYGDLGSLYNNIFTGIGALIILMLIGSSYIPEEDGDIELEEIKY